MTQLIFSSEVHLAIHLLGGSRANRHHTPNPQSGATQPIQDKNPQATRNPLELPLALRRGRHKNPSQSQWSKLKTITFLHSTIHQSPGRIGVDKHQE
jgi:hypothetical protein